MFPNRYSKHDHVYCNCGSPIKNEYQLRIVDDHEEIVETGKTNLYEYIQSHADSVDITKILEKCAVIGDYSILNRMPAQFMDVTDAPKSLAEALTVVKDAQNYFDRLPLDIKEKYNNNYIEFISDIGSEKFNNVVRTFVDSVRQKEEKKVEVKNNES